jgi:hypothetical protein
MKKISEVKKMVSVPESLKKVLASMPVIVGIGPSAWPRIISSYFFPEFKIISCNDCQDDELIRSTGQEVFSLMKEDPFLEVTPMTPGKIIETDLAKKYLAGLGEPFTFLVYKTYPLFEKICADVGWQFIGNTIEKRERYEDKRIFKEIIRSLDIEAIPGENIPINDLTKKRFKEYQKILGRKKLVLQIAEATWGGGSGTFFIDDAANLNIFFERVAELRKTLEGKKKELKTVNIAPFIDGTSASIPCCATKYGVLTGSIQSQIIDIPEVGAKLGSRSGIFAGHDWGYRKYSDESNIAASAIGVKFGRYMYEHGYKGLFGLDLIVEDSGKVWPVECNPRETDAFPLICMLQMEAGAVPMQVFHNLELLGTEYKIDFEKINKSYKKSFKASQVLIYNKTGSFIIDRKTLKAGVYEMVSGEMIFIRPGFAIWDLKNENEFLLTEDISKVPGNIYDPHERMLRLIRKGTMLDENGNFKNDAKEIVDHIYEALKFMPVEIGLTDKMGLKVLAAKKLKDAEKSPDLPKADMINVIRKAKEGIARPLDIVWRKHIGISPILGQIKSKRARKQIISDTAKIEKMGITVRIIEEIDEPLFKKWLSLYRNIIGSKEQGDILLTWDYLKNKKAEGKKVGLILAEKGTEIIGGEIFLEKNGILGIGYGVSKKVEGLSGGLTLLMDYKFMEYAQSKKYTDVSFGQDDNFYGYDLNPGLILYKAKLGFTPEIAKRTYWATTYFRNFKKIKDPVMFFAGDFKRITNLTVITDSEDGDYRGFLPEGVKEIKVYKRSELLETGKHMLSSD